MTDTKKEARKKPLENQEEESVDRIRDILFGAQMKDYEKRFLALESRLLQESEELRREVNNRFEALESFFQKELDSLTNRAKTEEHRRNEAEGEIQVEIKASKELLEKKVAKLNDETGESLRDLRQQLLGQSKDLGEEIRRKSDQLSSTLLEEIAQLRAAKTDRTALASMLTEVAMRLNEDAEPAE